MFVDHNNYQARTTNVFTNSVNCYGDIPGQNGCNAAPERGPESSLLGNRTGMGSTGASNEERQRLLAWLKTTQRRREENNEQVLIKWYDKWQTTGKAPGVLPSAAELEVASRGDDSTWHPSPPQPNPPAMGTYQGQVCAYPNSPHFQHYSHCPSHFEEQWNLPRVQPLLGSNIMTQSMANQNFGTLYRSTAGTSSTQHMQAFNNFLHSIYYPTAGQAAGIGATYSSLSSGTPCNYDPFHRIPNPSWWNGTASRPGYPLSTPLPTAQHVAPAAVNPRTLMVDNSSAAVNTRSQPHANGNCDYLYPTLAIGGPSSNNMNMFSPNSGSAFGFAQHQELNADSQHHTTNE